MTPARPTAILFDLWGTLVPPRPDRRDAVSHLMAADLGVGGDEFAAAVRDSHAERFSGRMGTLAKTLRVLAKRCGGDPAAAALERAAARRLDVTRELLVADERTLDALDALRDEGFRLGLVSDSSIETPTAWPGCPLASRIAATGFSCLLGVRKPHPGIYLHVTRRLGVAPEQCLYVGDGDSRELSGAAALGMTALRIRLPGDRPSDRYEDDADFTGPGIDRLGELVGSSWLGMAVP